MKITPRLPFILLIISAVAGYLLYDPGWECGVVIDIGHMQRDANNLSMRDTTIRTYGVLIDTQYTSLSSPATFGFDFYGDGQYRFRDIKNIQKIGLYADRAKVYEGPPLERFHIGPGKFAIDIFAQGAAHLRISNQCSIKSLVNGLRNSS